MRRGLGWPKIGFQSREPLEMTLFTRYEQLTTVRAQELLAIHGVGPKAIRILEEELKARGLSFLVERG